MAAAAAVVAVHAAASARTPTAGRGGDAARRQSAVLTGVVAEALLVGGLVCRMVKRENWMTVLDVAPAKPQKA